MTNLIARPITNEEARIFDRNGVVLLKGILNLNAVNMLRSAIDAAFQTASHSQGSYDLTDVTRHIMQNNIAELATETNRQYNVVAMAQHIQNSGEALLVDDVQAPQDGKGHFYLDTGIAARLKHFRMFALNSGIARVAGELMGSEKINFYDDQIFIKEPGTLERTSWHQDAPYFHIEGDQTCVMWVPVDPVTLENGAIQYVRGSHKWSKWYKPNVFIANTAFPNAEGEDLPDIDGKPDDYDIIHFDTEPGDVIVHHYLTIHGSGGNHSRYQVRRAASLRYCGDDIRYKYRSFAPTQSHHKHNLKDGDPLDSNQFPVIWQRSWGIPKVA